MNELNRQVEREGLDYLQIVIYITVLVSLMFGATFCHAQASRAQVYDVMPVLQVDMVYMPQVTR